MGREIKFRAWFQDKMWMQEDIQEDGWELAALWVKDSPIIFMQFTGLHDKSGREVYEHDLIRIDESIGAPAVVVFVNEYVGGWNLEAKGKRCSLGARTPDQLEIVGNLFENPELLEKGAG